jgi:O-antigen/teichoic acid export membrane protein
MTSRSRFSGGWGLARSFANRLRDAKVLRQSAWYMFDRLFVAATTFIFTAILARTYGPQAVGKWAFAQNSLQIFLPFLAVGAEPAIIRFMVLSPSERPSIITNGLLFFSAMTTVVISLGTILTLFSTRDSESLLLFWIFAFAALPSISVIFEHQFKADGIPAPIILSHTVVATSGSVVRTIMALKHAELTYIAWVVGAEALLNATLLLRFTVRHREPDRVFGAASAAVFRDIALAVAPIAGAAFITSAFIRVNLVLLERLSTFSEVGRYSIALSVVQIFALVPAALSTALYPRFLRAAKDGGSSLIVLTGRAMYLFTLLGYAACISVAIVAPLLPMILGDKFSSVGKLIAILGIGTIFASAGAARSLYINSINRPSVHMVSSGVGLATLVMSGLILIPRWGAVGAAIGQVLGYFFAVFCSSLVIGSMRPIRAMQFRSLIGVPSRTAAT